MNIEEDKIKDDLYNKGLEAFRMQIFPELNQSIWLWCVDDVTTSCGGRFEFFNNQSYILDIRFHIK